MGFFKAPVNTVVFIDWSNNVHLKPYLLKICILMANLNTTTKKKKEKKRIILNYLHNFILL